MRETIFRGKDRFGSWHEGFLNYQDTAICIHVIENIPPSISEPCGDSYSEYFPVDPKTVGEYIRRKDCNEKRIFTGCKVAVNIFTNEFNLNKPVRGFDAEVIFSEHRSMYLLKTGNNHISFDEITENDEIFSIEIIGTIHD